MTASPTSPTPPSGAFSGSHAFTVPNPTVCLRNRFTIRPDGQRDFIEGKRGLLSATHDMWTLIAAGSKRPMDGKTSIYHPGLDGIHIWELDDWAALYNSVFTFSESDWYRRLGSSLVTEVQELLVVSAGHAPVPHPTWETATKPGYTYLYEEALPFHGKTHTYLRELNFFTEQVKRYYGWTRAWTATQLTARPSVISVLWRIPNDNPWGDPGESIDRTLSEFVNGGDGPLSKLRKHRYESMMSTLEWVTREPLFPLLSERIDDEVKNQFAGARG